MSDRLIIPATAINTMLDNKTIFALDTFTHRPAIQPLKAWPRGLITPIYISDRGGSFNMYVDSIIRRKENMINIIKVIMGQITVKRINLFDMC